MGSADLLAGRYALEHIAGHGGMAVVYAAFDTVLERRVAIKYLHRDVKPANVLVAEGSRSSPISAWFGPTACAPRTVWRPN